MSGYPQHSGHGRSQSGDHLFNGHYLRHPAERSTQHVRQKACSNDFLYAPLPFLDHCHRYSARCAVFHGQYGALILAAAGLEKINFLGSNTWFRPMIIATDVWKEFGYNSIVYLAAITSIDPSLYEAATLDGAGRWGKIWHVTLPGIKSTIMILLIMNVGNVLNAGFEVQYLLGNGLVKSVSETIDIYTLTWGISQNDYSLGTAAGIFKSVVAIILILGANWIAKRAGEDRLF